MSLNPGFQQPPAAADESSEQRLALFTRLSKGIALLALTLGALVLAGWAAEIQLLKSVRPYYVAMKPNTALAFLAAAGALWAAHQRTRAWAATARLLAAATALIGALTLLEHLAGWNLHIDELLFRETGPLVASAIPGRMAPLTALSFTLLGTGMAVMRHPSTATLAQCFAFLAASFSLLTLNSHLLGVHDFPGTELQVAMAVHTAAGLLLLSLGLLFASADRGFMRSISSPSPGGVMAIRLLPCVVLLPSILGWLRWQGERHGWYEPAFGVALLASACSVCLAFLVWSAASLLNGLDLARARAEAEIRHFNQTLEARVAQHTAELLLEREKLQRVLDAATNVSIIATTVDGIITVFNAGAEHMLGYRAQETIGKQTPALIHLESEVIARGVELTAETGREVGGFDVFVEAARHGRHEEREWTYVRKDGSHITVNLVVTALRDAGGVIAGFLGVAMDTSARKQAETASHENEERFHSIIDAVKDYSIVTLDPNGCVTTWNAGAERLNGYKAEEILGKHFSMFYSPAEREADLPAAELRIAESKGESRREGWRIRKDGRRFWSESLITAVRNGDGSLRGFSKIAHNITERKLAEERFRMIFDMAPNAMVMVGSDGRIELANVQTAKLFGHKREELLGQPVEMLVPERLRAAHAGHRDTFLRAPNIRTVGLGRELFGLHKDGSEIPLEIGLSPVTSVEGSFVLASIIDIRERRRAAAALDEAHSLLECHAAELAQTNKELAQKNEEVEAFVYIVSHDLRGPLVNLQGFCKELELSCDELLGQTSSPAADLQVSSARIHTILTKEIPDSLRYINLSTAKFHRLINALLELSRYGRQQYRSEELDLSPLIQSTVDLMRLSIAASGAWVCVGPVPKVYGDATALGQVYANLIGNAIKYLQPGRPGQIEIGGEMAGAEAHCWVRDNGAGLPASAKPRLFQVFQRFHPDLAPGEGMGLAIVRRVIERHGGRIWAEGEEGVGTTFHFTLPLGGNKHG
jgi:PAS domain S-box-containing protein